MGRSGRLAAAAAIFATMLIPGAGPHEAEAERAQRDGVVVSLDGRISPRTLPRGRSVPVGVDLTGSIHTLDGSPLPRLDRIEIDLAGSGHLSVRGLPKCPGGRLRSADSHQALYRCGPALVGSGLMKAEVHLPGQGPFRLHGRLLAFNGTVGGRPAVWMHVFSYAPPVSLAVPFVIERRGRTRTSLVASLPEWIGSYPHFAWFDMKLFRRFQYRGEFRSYARASCPIPPAFTAGFLAFAHATYSFHDQRQVSVESVRSCRAR